MSASHGKGWAFTWLDWGPTPDIPPSRRRITHLVVLPLYPQFSISTSGSSLRLLEQYFRSDSYLRYMKHTVIPSWYQARRRPRWSVFTSFMCLLQTICRAPD